MSRYRTRTEVWAIPFSRAVRFFEAQPDVTAEDGGFAFRQCRIRLTPLPDRTLGSLRFPQTELALEGAEGDLDEIYQRYYYTFVSAGG